MKVIIYLVGMSTACAGSEVGRCNLTRNSISFVFTAMGNKSSSSSHADDENRVAFTGEDEHSAEEAKGKPQRSQRARKVLRQTSVAVKKAVIANATVTEVESINVKDTMEVILVGKELTEFPDAISVMSSLSILNLCKNSISEIPPEIAQVNTLTKLILAGNQIVSVPEEIGGLQNLEELILTDNPKLASLPDQLDQCKSLKVLHIAKCRFRSIPECIGTIGVRKSKLMAKSDISRFKSF